MKRTKTKNETIYIAEDEILSNSIIPLNRKELKRNVQLYGKTFIEGGVFANELVTEGRLIYIRKSINIQDGISIKLQENSLHWFNSVVAAKNNILVKKTGEGRIRFSNSIDAQKINLFNTVVYGNIYCEDLILHNCVVFGGIYSKSSISVTNSIIGTYEAKRITFNSDNAIILPFGISDEVPVSNGKIYNIISKDFSVNDDLGVFEIMQEEFYPINDNGSKKFVFSPFMRVFDLSFFHETMGKNLLSLSHFTNINVEDIEKDNKTFMNFENVFFTLINKKFATDKTIPISRFMEANDDLVKDFIENKQQNKESELSENNMFSNNPEPEKVEYSNQTVSENDSISEKSHCPQCGNIENINDQDTSFCTNCGLNLDYNTTINKSEEQYDTYKSEEMNFTQENSKVNESSEELLQKCPQCQNKMTEPGQLFCTDCGYKIKTTNTIICNKCNTENSHLNKFCESCGTSLGD